MNDACEITSEKMCRDLLQEKKEMSRSRSLGRGHKKDLQVSVYEERALYGRDE